MNRTHVCEYQQEERVKVQMPTVHAFTATVRVYRPGCYTNAPACVNYERRGKDSEQGKTDDTDDGGCSVRTKTSTNSTGQITQDGEIYYLVDNSQDNNANRSDGEGSKKQLLDAPESDEEDKVSTVQSDHSHRGKNHNKDVNREKGISEYTNDEPSIRDVAEGGKSSPSVFRRESEVNTHQRPSSLTANRRRWNEHHHTQSSLTDTTTPSTRRAHRRRHRGRSPSSRDEDVTVETTYTSGRNGYRHRYNNNETKFDAYSYTIIMTDGKKNGRRREEETKKEQVSRREENIDAYLGKSYDI
ncbi:putative multiple epidermal growth factor-like 2 [Homarus americanus]|uniref:Putative multiple epidermal growth factor-like 2 n=1 Tax=Homarus americanus TaxID=6706 RepID=A0A8J5T4T3_HOMAM|nr:putative multiple epidermal growth factor-like 2 [Homarus americanus]